VFFDILKENGIRKSNKAIDDLIEFLCIDYNIYNKGLMIKKIEKSLIEFAKSDYLKTIGTRKKQKLEKKIT
jgi:hypothetical protein